MGYYHIELTPESQRLCTIILPWGKYKYKNYPWAYATAQKFLRKKMNKLFAGLEYVRSYINNLLVISKGSFKDHLEKLDQVLKKLKAARLKINASRSFFTQEELEYLGYWITCEGILLVKKKISAMLNISKPKTRK